MIDDWIAKLVAEHDAGNITEAVALVPARVDTEWFRRLNAFPRCFVRRDDKSRPPGKSARSRAMGANRDNARRSLRHEAGERCGEMDKGGTGVCHYSTPK